MNKNSKSEVKFFGKSYPLDFKLYNSNDQEVLYIDDIATGHSIYLEITNMSKQGIVLAKPSSDTAGSNNYHFELRFRPGTLYNPSQITLAESNDWSMSSPETHTTNGLVSFYILSKTEQTLIPSQFLKLTLQQVCAAGGEGSRGTQVELKYQQLHYTGTNMPLIGNRVQHLNLINRRGGEYIPLHAGFVGSNVVLNDGTTKNTLTLRLTNTGEHDILLTTNSKFIISFDVGDKKSKPWGLGTASEVASIEMTLPENIQNNWTQTAPSKEDQSPKWLLTHKKNMSIPVGMNLTLTLSNIITALPSGHTNIRIAYKNIQGYWDGQFICVLEKLPLMTDGEKVGIGTNIPSGKLDVRLKGDDISTTALVVGKENKTDYLTVSNDGKIGIGTTKPTTELEVNGYIKDKTGYVMPTGGIIMWSGAKNDIPHGWALCDGNHGTPDLRDRFIVGAGKDYNQNDSGGPDGHLHDISPASQSFTTSDDGKHTHGCFPEWSDRQFDSGAWNTHRYSGIDRGNQSVKDAKTQSAGSHTHTVQINLNTFKSGNCNQEIKPKWYALCYIMKL